MKKQEPNESPSQEKGENEVCPQCGSPMGEVTITQSGKKLQRCSTGTWNSETKQVDGCDYVRWLSADPEQLDEKCPKCGSALLMVTTRFGKKLKRCSTAKWDPKTKESSGCDYVEWMKGTTEELEEDCPTCGAKLVLVTTASGKRLKKCSTNHWNREEKVSEGCNYVQWM